MGNQESFPDNKKVIRKIKKKKIVKTSNENYEQKSNIQSNSNLNNYGNKIMHQYNNQQQINQQQINQQQINQQQINQQQINQKRNNIVPIKNDQEYNDFSNYNYEMKTKNKDLNSMLVERSMMQNKKVYLESKGSFLERPHNSNFQLSNPKPNFDNIKFDPNNFNDKVNVYKKSIDEEKEDFELDIEKQKVSFYENQKKKQKRLEQAIHEFEDNYDPWDILGLEYGDLDIQNIKRAYKKNALKFHPDKVGDKYENVFNIINQSYIYLLKKSEETNEKEIKSTRDVVNREYESHSDGMENMHIDKENFNLNKFNDIFEKFRIDEEIDSGYSDLLKNNDENNQPLFSSKVSNEIFNEHFNKIKKKKSDALIEYDEPQSIDASGSLGAVELGGSFEGGFGSSQSSHLGYTDIKQAHYEENLLINPESVKYKNYNSIDEYEHERSQISHKPNQVEKMKYIKIDNKNKLKEQKRVELLREHDNRLKNNYHKINKKLIVHK